MMPTLEQAVLIGLTYFAANTAFLGGLAYFTTWRPLVNGLIVGLILGDPFRGAVLGALINLLYLGYVSAGGTLGIGDAALAGILGATIGVVTKSQGLGILAGVLLGMLGFQLLLLRMRVDDRIAAAIDAAAVRGDHRRMQWLHIVVAQLWLLLITTVPVAFVALALPFVLRELLPLLPTAVYDGLALGGRLTVALGLALALRDLFQGWRIALFFAGALWTVFRLPFEALIAFGLIGLLTAALSRPAAPGLALTATAPVNWRPFWLWQFFSHSNYSLSRLQGSGLACAVASDLPERTSVNAHTGFFNTEVNVGAMIPALIVRLSRDGTPVSDIAKLKGALMGTLAGFGDALTQGAILPALLAAAIGALFGLTGIAAVGVFVLVVGVVMLTLSLLSYRAGWQHGPEAAAGLLANGQLRVVSDWLRYFVVLAIGALAASPAVLRLPIPTYGLWRFEMINAAGAVALVLGVWVCLRQPWGTPGRVLTGLVFLAVLLQLAQNAA
jgi:mannose PTS system EIID component